MDKATADYFKRMAELRQSDFVPETLGGIGSYYKENLDKYAARSAESATRVGETQTAWEKLLADATAARDAGQTSFMVNGKSAGIQSIFDKKGEVRNIDDIIRSSQWYSTSKGKMMAGRIGSVASAFREAQQDNRDDTSSTDSYSKLYEEELAALEERNRKRHADWLAQRDATLNAGQASAYRGATYQEKPL